VRPQGRNHATFHENPLGAGAVILPQPYFGIFGFIFGMIVTFGICLLIHALPGDLGFEWQRLDVASRLHTDTTSVHRHQKQYRPFIITTLINNNVYILGAAWINLTSPLIETQGLSRQPVIYTKAILTLKGSG
jgi:hypothetical protein